MKNNLDREKYIDIEFSWLKDSQVEMGVEFAVNIIRNYSDNRSATEFYLSLSERELQISK